MVGYNNLPNKLVFPLDKQGFMVLAVSAQDPLVEGPKSKSFIISLL